MKMSNDEVRGEGKREAGGAVAREKTSKGKMIPFSRG